MPSDFNDQGFLQKEDRIAGGDPQPHLIVFTNGEVHIERADSLEDASFHQHRTGTDDAQRQAAMIDPSVVLAMDFLGIDSSAISNPGLVSVDHPVLGMALEDFNLPVQLGRFPGVVAVQEADPGEAGELNAGVPSTAYPLISLENVVNTTILEFSDDFPALIIGAVIHHQQFPFGEGLVDH